MRPVFFGKNFPFLQNYSHAKCMRNTLVMKFSNLLSHAEMMHLGTITFILIHLYAMWRKMYRYMTDRKLPMWSRSNATNKNYNGLRCKTEEFHRVFILFSKAPNIFNKNGIQYTNKNPVRPAISCQKHWNNNFVSFAHNEQATSIHGTEHTPR